MLLNYLFTSESKSEPKFLKFYLNGNLPRIQTSAVWEEHVWNVNQSDLHLQICDFPWRSENTYYLKLNY